MKISYDGQKTFSFAIGPQPLCWFPQISLQKEVWNHFCSSPEIIRNVTKAESSSSTLLNVERVLFYMIKQLNENWSLSLWKFNSAIHLSKCVHKLNFFQIRRGTDAADSQRLISNLLVTEVRRSRRHLQIPKLKKKTSHFNFSTWLLAAGAHIRKTNIANDGPPALILFHFHFLSVVVTNLIEEVEPNTNLSFFMGDLCRKGSSYVKS